MVAQQITVGVPLRADDLSDGPFEALLLLGIASLVAALTLGLSGRAAAAPYSGDRSLSTFAVVLGVIGLIGFLAFTLLVLARGTTRGWGRI